MTDEVTPIDAIRQIDDVLGRNEAKGKLHGEYLNATQQLALMGIRTRAVRQLIKDFEVAFPARPAKAAGI